jgi:hypothetical protein
VPRDAPHRRLLAHSRAPMLSPGRRVIGSAGAPRIRFHDARHTCGTLLHLQGVPVAVISAWLGHSDAAFTMKVYVHSQPDMLNDVKKHFERGCDICVTPGPQSAGMQKAPDCRVSAIPGPAVVRPARFELATS